MIVWLVACRAEFRDLEFRNGAIAGVGTVTWDSRVEGRARVEYAPEGEPFDGITPELDAAAGEATVLGLRVATKYQFRVVVEDDEGEEHVSDEFPGEVDPPPVGTPTFTVNWHQPELACETGGFVLLNDIGNFESGVGIIDRSGRYVWSVRSPPGVQFTRPRAGRDGRSVLWNTNDEARAVDIATVERMSLDGSVVRSTRTLNAHHDFVELPDGNMAWLAYGEAASVGVPQLDGDCPIAYDQVYEAPEGVTEADAPTLVFDHLADWPDGVYFNGQQRCDTFLPGRRELGHGNSLAYIAATDEYTVGLRWIDAILRLDRSGGLRWVLGGPAATVVVPDAADLPVGPHFSDVWDGGMMVFDNHDPGPSRLVEYTVPAEGAGTSIAWQLTGADILAANSEAAAAEDVLVPGFENFLGDVRRIPVEGCENVLVSWSGSGVLQELTREGVVVWEVGYQSGNATGRVQYLSSLYDFADQAYPE